MKYVIPDYFCLDNEKKHFSTLLSRLVETRLNAEILPKKEKAASLAIVKIETSPLLYISSRNPARIVMNQCYFRICLFLCEISFVKLAPRWDI